MDDSISRKQAIDGIKKEILERDGRFYKGLLVANHVIVHLPSAQPEQPEIIRCKDCKYRDDDDFCIGRGYPNSLVPDDGFCDKGERSE